MKEVEWGGEGEGGQQHCGPPPLILLVSGLSISISVSIHPVDKIPLSGCVIDLKRRTR